MSEKTFKGSITQREVEQLIRWHNDEWYYLTTAGGTNSEASKWHDERRQLFGKLLEQKAQE